jgi:phosphatidylcholine synthase
LAIGEKQAQNISLIRRLVAWAIHAYTASGGILGMAALFAAAEERYQTAFLLLLATMFIDATDGTLARTARVKDALPTFSGGEIDNVIDFLTYVWVPIFIMWKLSLLPHPILLGVPILAALYAYGQSNMKSSDGYFIGFPSYWNIIALYLFWLQPVPGIAALIVIVPGVLSFIPTRYLYPSRGGPLWRTTYVLTAIWGAALIYLLLQSDPPMWLVLVTLLYPIYYLAGSCYVEVRARRASTNIAGKLA